jgi:F-type H+-transporting ATPase subunit epsilon
MYLEIVTPEATLFSGEVNSVSVPGLHGSFELLNNHAPIVSLLQEGHVILRGVHSKEDLSDLLQKQTEGHYALKISSGTVECNNNRVVVLAD